MLSILYYKVKLRLLKINIIKEEYSWEDAVITAIDAIIGVITLILDAIIMDIITMDIIIMVTIIVVAIIVGSYYLYYSYVSKYTYLKLIWHDSFI